MKCTIKTPTRYSVIYLLRQYQLKRIFKMEIHRFRSNTFCTQVQYDFATQLYCYSNNKKTFFLNRFFPPIENGILPPIYIIYIIAHFIGSSWSCLTMNLICLCHITQMSFSPALADPSLNQAFT